MKDSILGLFFTRGVSLETWLNQGLFEREKLLYEEHLKKSYFNKVFWFTYGNSDVDIARKLKKDGKLHQDIYVFEMPSIFKIPMVGSWIYSVCLPFIQKQDLKKCILYKSNQIDGSWSALLASKLYNKHFINRTGYTLSLFGKRKNLSFLKQCIIIIMERIAYRYADVNIVTSADDRRYLIDRYKLKDNRIHLIHNYIDTSLFRPQVSKRYTKKIIFVGRLDNQKNLFNLAAAVAKMGLELDIYGEGKLKNDLINYSRTLNAKVNFMGVVANSELPAILNKYQYYILPSLYEGMPKTLLEAMACGSVCIGTKVSGISEVLEHGVNGYLSNETDVVGIVTALKSALKSDDPQLISDNARRTILEHFSLQKIVEKELVLFQGVLKI